MELFCVQDKLGVPLGHPGTVPREEAAYGDQYHCHHYCQPQYVMDSGVQLVVNLFYPDYSKD